MKELTPEEQEIIKKIEESSRQYHKNDNKNDETNKVHLTPLAHNNIETKHTPNSDTPNSVVTGNLLLREKLDGTVVKGVGGKKRRTKKAKKAKKTKKAKKARKTRRR